MRRAWFIWKFHRRRYVGCLRIVKGFDAADRIAAELNGTYGVDGWSYQVEDVPGPPPPVFVDFGWGDLVMALDIRFVALQSWPGVPTKSHARQRSRFDSPWSKTIDLLERELDHLRAREVVIQADCDRDQIRLDGMFRANAKMRGPGVVLSFESKHGPLSYPCDTFTDWQSNVRAIALALEALRAVDRYGVTRQAEQYRGWAALPDKSQQGPFADSAAACEWLTKELESNVAALCIGETCRALDEYRSMYRSEKRGE